MWALFHGNVCKNERIGSHGGHALAAPPGSATTDSRFSNLSESGDGVSKDKSYVKCPVNFGTIFSTAKFMVTNCNCTDSYFAHFIFCLMKLPLLLSTEQPCMSNQGQLAGLPALQPIGWIKDFSRGGC